ncbi:MAG: hypothetical protein ACX93T_03485 [Bacteroidota bacterium]
MYKKLILLLYLLSSAYLMHASSFLKAGLLGGIQISQYPGPANDIQLDSARQLRDHGGYHVGAFTRLNLLVCHVQPEIILTTTEGPQSSPVDEEAGLYFMKLDIPTMVGFSLLGIARVQAGPILSLLLSAEIGQENIKKYYKSPTVGWQAGVGIDIWRICMDLRYEGSLSRWGNKIAGIYTNHKATSSWILSIGINMLS